jgi:hypothetical protein
MARATDTDTNSMPKATLNKIMDSKITGKELVNSSRMDMGNQTRLMRMDTKKPTARRIDNMTHGVNSDQAGEDMRSNPMELDMLGMAMLVDSITIPA